MKVYEIPVAITKPVVSEIPLKGEILKALTPPTEPNWDLVRRTCDAVYQGTEAEFLKAEK